MPDHAAFQSVALAVERSGYKAKAAERCMNRLGDMAAESGRVHSLGLG